MTAKPLTSEAIALTEKKMDMTLGIIVSYTCFTPLFWFSSSPADNQLVLADDIIKMSRTNTTKPKKQRVSVSTSLSDHLVFISAFVSLIWNRILTFIICFLQNRSQKFSNNVAQDKSAKIQKFMDTRSSMRQVLITISEPMKNLMVSFSYWWMLNYTPLLIFLCLEGSCSKKIKFSGRPVPFGNWGSQKVSSCSYSQ